MDKERWKDILLYILIILSLKTNISATIKILVQWTLSNSNSQGEFEFVRIMESSD